MGAAYSTAESDTMSCEESGALRRVLARARMLIFCCATIFLWGGAACAQEVVITSAEPQERPPMARTLGLGTAGVLSAFLAHEAGHVAANLMMGNVPRIEGFLTWGFVPFFAIAPRIECQGERCVKHDGEPFGPGRRGKFFIVTAGYEVQHITDEIILTRNPRLRDEWAPFQKGMLLFNVFLSCFYVAGQLTGLEDPHGDLQGAVDMSGFDGRLLSLALLAPAALDTVRYFVPTSERWSAWASRGGKLTFLGLGFAF
jgi:hypothetical protein